MRSPRRYTKCDALLSQRAWHIPGVSKKTLYEYLKRRPVVEPPGTERSV